MATDIILAGAFTTSSPATKKTGLTVTAVVYKVTISATPTITNPSGTVFEIGGGMNGVYVASADLAAAFYYATLHTADTSVLAQDVMAVIWEVYANVDKVQGTTQTARDLGASVLLSSGTGTGQVSLSSGAVLLQATQTGVTIPTVTSVTNDVGITQAAADKVWSTTTRALTDKIGFALSAAGVQAVWDALASALTTANSIGKRLADDIDATISSRTKPTDTQARVTLVDTVTTTTTATNLTNAPTVGDFTAAMKTSLNNATPTPADSTTLLEINADVDELIVSVAALVPGAAINMTAEITEIHVSSE